MVGGKKRTEQTQVVCPNEDEGKQKSTKKKRNKWRPSTSCCHKDGPLDMEKKTQTTM